MRENSRYAAKFNFCPAHGFPPVAAFVVADAVVTAALAVPCAREYQFHRKRT